MKIFVTSFIVTLKMLIYLKQGSMDDHRSIISLMVLAIKTQCWSSDEPWFDRQLKYFEPIFDFYQSGNKIQRNEYLDLDFFLDELEFFKVRPTQIRTLWTFSVAGRTRRSSGLWLIQKLRWPKRSFQNVPLMNISPRIEIILNIMFL